MGISANWISVGGLSKAEVLARMGLEETGEVLSLVESWFDSDAVAGVATLPGGRVLVLSDSELCPLESAAEVAAGCELVWVERVDTVSYVKTVGFRDGRQVWSVERNPDLPELFKTTGELPSGVQSLIPADGDHDPYETALRVPGEIGRYDPEEDLDGFDARLDLLQYKGAKVRPRRARASRNPSWDYALRARFPWLGPAIAVGSMAMFFWWGSHFDLFGKDIDYRHEPWQTVGHFGWIVLMIFGVAFWLGGIRIGLRVAVGVTILFGGAGLIGAFTRMAGAWLRQLG
jgi:hypothetical protein